MIGWAVMRIGIYGSGMIGGTLAKLWLSAGHEVRFGARDPERTRRKTPSIDSRAGVGTLDEVARWGEAFLLAIPLHGIPALAAAAAAGLSGKPVLDASNAIASRTVMPRRINSTPVACASRST